MMMRFATATLATILLAGNSAASSYPGLPTVRGVETAPTPLRGWSLHPNGDETRRRRHLESGNECLLVLKDIQFEDNTIEEDNWACEFPYARAKLDFNGREFMDIDVPKAVIDEMGAVSGASILKTRGAFIEESLKTNEMVMHVPDDAHMKVETLHKNDPRHYKQRRMKSDRALRQLAESGPGTLSVLVVRVVAADDAQISATNEQLKDDIFTDDFSLKTGYAQCSKDQLIIEPAEGNGVSDGIITIKIDINAVDGNKNLLQQEVLKKAGEEYGNISSQYDLVMVCQPPGSGEWIAYAYINSWVSFYNDYWCQRVSAQMHEVGHNLGLGHSNQGSQKYGDQSSMMGYSYNIDDGPKMCFDAVKNFQLGWYTRQQESYSPLVNKNTVQNFVLNGVDDYKTEGTTNGKLVTLRLVEYGEEFDESINNYGKDYYIGFNRATGANSGTIEAANQVVVFEKATGGPDGYGESNRIADLDVDGSFTISNFRGAAFDVIIRVESISNNGLDANIEISHISDGVPTESPTESCGGVGRLAIELNMDIYAFETSWELIDNESDEVIESAPKENHASQQTYLYPNDASYYCLEERKCYTFKINDTFGDGLNNGEGNYKLYLDNELEYEGGDAEKFKSEEKYILCVGDDTNNEDILQKTETPTKSPTSAPTSVPTLVPTAAPTSQPTQAPTKSPTKSPTNEPTTAPTVFETPTKSPTSAPTSVPTLVPTAAPTSQPTQAPTKSPTKSPTNEPTTAPTVFDDIGIDTNPPTGSPTSSCDDRPEFLWKNKNKKNCKWASKGSAKKVVKKCKKSNGDGKKVYDYCPATCAKVDKGPCK